MRDIIDRLARRAVVVATIAGSIALAVGIASASVPATVSRGPLLARPPQGPRVLPPCSIQCHAAMGTR